jgi:hypothetical protein
MIDHAHRSYVGDHPVSSEALRKKPRISAARARQLTKITRMGTSQSAGSAGANDLPPIQNRTGYRAICPMRRIVKRRAAIPRRP